MRINENDVIKFLKVFSLRIWARTHQKITIDWRKLRLKLKGQVWFFMNSGVGFGFDLRWMGLQEVGYEFGNLILVFLKGTKNKI